VFNRIYGFLGLAAKAGQVISGDNSCERAIHAGRAKLVIVAEDAADNTKKKFNNICMHKNVDIVFYGKKELLGKYTGKDVRSVLAITNESFATRLKELTQSSTVENGGEMIGKGKNI